MADVFPFSEPWLAGGSWPDAPDSPAPLPAGVQPQQRWQGRRGETGTGGGMSTVLAARRVVGSIVSAIHVARAARTLVYLE